MSWVVLGAAGVVSVADPWTSFLSSFNLIDAGSTGLLALVIVMILMGKLVPKSVADAWKDAYHRSEEAGQVKDDQISRLVASTSVTARVLDALPKASGGDPDETSAPHSRR